jgi:hypothetical protein
MTLKGAEGNQVRPRWKVAGETAWLVAASVVLVFFGMAAGNLSGYLAEVRPAAGGPRVWEANPLDAGWVQTLAVTSLALFAVVGFPHAGRRWWRARGGVAGAIVQGLGGLWVAGGTVAAHLFLAGLYRLDPTEVTCVYPPTCWPERPQALAHSIPGVLAGMTMVLMAVLFRRLPWWVRGLLPVLVWVAAVALQYAVLAPRLVPIFEGPPG